MATRSVTTSICDLPHDGDEPAMHVISFSWDGVPREADLCELHAKELRDVLGDLAGHGRKRRAPRQAPPKRTNASRQRAAEVRAWAQKQGLIVGDRGRIPVSVLARYERAH